jgi:hypothetical protein
MLLVWVLVPDPLAQCAGLSLDPRRIKLATCNPTLARPDLLADVLRCPSNWISVEVRIALSGLSPRMTQQLGDDGQPQPAANLPCPCSRFVSRHRAMASDSYEPLRGGCASNFRPIPCEVGTGPGDLDPQSKPFWLSVPDDVARWTRRVSQARNFNTLTIAGRSQENCRNLWKCDSQAECRGFDSHRPLHPPPLSSP